MFGKEKEIFILIFNKVKVFSDFYLIVNMVKDIFQNRHLRLMSRTHAPLSCGIKNFIENLHCSSNTGHGREPHLNISNTVTLPPAFHGSIQRSARKDIRGDRTTERRHERNQLSQVIPQIELNRRIRNHLQKSQVAGSKFTKILQ